MSIHYQNKNTVQLYYGSTKIGLGVIYLDGCKVYWGNASDVPIPVPPTPSSSGPPPSSSGSTPSSSGPTPSSSGPPPSSSGAPPSSPDPTPSSSSPTPSSPGLPSSGSWTPPPAPPAPPSDSLFVPGWYVIHSIQTDYTNQAGGVCKNGCVSNEMCLIQYCSKSSDLPRWYCTEITWDETHTWWDYSCFDFKITYIGDHKPTDAYAEEICWGT